MGSGQEGSIALLSTQSLSCTMLIEHMYSFLKSVLDKRNIDPSQVNEFMTLCSLKAKEDKTRYEASYNGMCYGEVLASLLSLYVDLEIAKLRLCDPQKTDKVLEHILSKIFYMLDPHNIEYVPEVMLASEDMTPQHVRIIIIMLQKLSSKEHVWSPLGYTKFVILCKLARKNCKLIGMSKSEVQKLLHSVFVPKNYIGFVKQLDNDLYDLLSINMNRIGWILYSEVEIDTLLQLTQSVDTKEADVTADSEDTFEDIAENIESESDDNCPVESFYIDLGPSASVTDGNNEQGVGGDKDSDGDDQEEDGGDQHSDGDDQEGDGGDQDSDGNEESEISHQNPASAFNNSFYAATNPLKDYGRECENTDETASFIKIEPLSEEYIQRRSQSSKSTKSVQSIVLFEDNSNTIPLMNKSLKCSTANQITADSKTVDDSGEAFNSDTILNKETSRKAQNTSDENSEDMSHLKEDMPDESREDLETNSCKSIFSQLDTVEENPSVAEEHNQVKAIVPDPKTEKQRAEVVDISNSCGSSTASTPTKNSRKSLSSSCDTQEHRLSLEPSSYPFELLSRTPSASADKTLKVTPSSGSKTPTSRLKSPRTPASNVTPHSKRTPRIRETIYDLGKERMIDRLVNESLKKEKKSKTRLSSPQAQIQETTEKEQLKSKDKEEIIHDSQPPVTSEVKDITGSERDISLVYSQDAEVYVSSKKRKSRNKEKILLEDQSTCDEKTDLELGLSSLNSSMSSPVKELTTSSPVSGEPGDSDLNNKENSSKDMGIRPSKVSPAVESQTSPVKSSPLSTRKSRSRRSYQEADADQSDDSFSSRLSARRRIVENPNIETIKEDIVLSEIKTKRSRLSTDKSSVVSTDSVPTRRSRRLSGGSDGELSSQEITHSSRRSTRRSEVKMPADSSLMAIEDVDEDIHSASMTVASEDSDAGTNDSVLLGSSATNSQTKRKRHSSSESNVTASSTYSLRSRRSLGPASLEFCSSASEVPATRKLSRF